jgi:hypothetical protein
VRPSVAQHVDAQYAGAKAGLRPSHDAVAAIALALGDDVSAEGVGGYTPFVRRRQSAATAAAARERVDLGLRFTLPPDRARLLPAKAPGQSTHKIELRSIEEVDDEVAGLLHAAYEQNG